MLYNLSWCGNITNAAVAAVWVCLDCLDLHYSKPKGEPVSEERYNWPVPESPETLLGQNERALS